MQQIGSTLKRRYEQIVIENQMLRAGFAALPYLVLRDTRLTPGARLSYAVLLSYAWQEEACFAGQEKMAIDMGVSERQLRRYLQELQDAGYIEIRQQGLNRPNLYFIRDVPTKLRRKRAKPPKSEADRTPVSDPDRTSVSDQERTPVSD